MSDEFLSLEPVEVNGKVVYVTRCGDLWRWTRTCKWSTPKLRKIEVKPNANGYICPQIGVKLVLIHRIIASAFLGLDITDLKKQVDHINGVRHDNRLENIRLVTHQQNNFNRTTSLGYCWRKQKNKWCARIKLNNREIFLGYFINEEDARKAYLDAKLKYHKFP